MKQVSNRLIGGWQHFWHETVNYMGVVSKDGSIPGREIFTPVSVQSHSIMLPEEGGQDKSIKSNIMLYPCGGCCLRLTKNLLKKGFHLALLVGSINSNTFMHLLNTERCLFFLSQSSQNIFCCCASFLWLLLIWCTYIQHVTLIVLVSKMMSNPHVQPAIIIILELFVSLLVSHFSLYHAPPLLHINHPHCILSFLQ